MTTLVQCLETVWWWLALVVLEEYWATHVVPAAVVLPPGLTMCFVAPVVAFGSRHLWERDLRWFGAMYMRVCAGTGFALRPYGRHVRMWAVVSLFLQVVMYLATLCAGIDFGNMYYNIRRFVLEAMCGITARMAARAHGSTLVTALVQCLLCRLNLGDCMQAALQQRSLRACMCMYAILRTMHDEANPGQPLISDYDPEVRTGLLGMACVARDLDTLPDFIRMFNKLTPSPEPHGRRRQTRTSILDGRLGLHAFQVLRTQCLGVSKDLWARVWDAVVSTCSRPEFLFNAAARSGLPTTDLCRVAALPGFRAKHVRRPFKALALLTAQQAARWRPARQLWVLTVASL
jgi:hypothetical protein